MTKDRFVIDLSEAPICRNCRFCEQLVGPIEVERPGRFGIGHKVAEIGIIGSGCSRVQIHGMDLVTGEGDARIGPLDADYCRNDAALCGVHGRWFQPIDVEFKA